MCPVHKTENKFMGKQICMSNIYNSLRRHKNIHLRTFSAYFIRKRFLFFLLHKCSIYEVLILFAAQLFTLQKRKENATHVLMTICKDAFLSAGSYIKVNCISITSKVKCSKCYSNACVVIFIHKCNCVYMRMTR